MSSEAADTARQALGADGPIAAHLPGFEPRSGQQEMAARIAAAIADGETLIAESGTGTGKTFAYLVPALLSGRRLLISTGTRHLQDQLFNRDLPLVRDALGVPVQAALLKGRANYLCLQRLEHRFERASGLDRRAQEELQVVAGWASRTRGGDIAEVVDVPEDSPVWPVVTSTPDNCLGSRCPHWDDCHVNRARRAALAADVVVVNHHLFFADLALKGDGYAQLLPGAEAVIFDEAHQLPEVAGAFLEVSAGSRQITELCRDALAEEAAERSLVSGLDEQVRVLQSAVVTMQRRLVARRALPWRGPMEQAAGPPLEGLREALAGLAGALDAASAAGEGLARCARRAGELGERLQWLVERDDVEHVRWAEVTAAGFRLHATPIEVGAAFQEAVSGGARAWVFVSATLSAGGSFEYFQRRLGLEQAATAVWPSPFDYGTQSLLYQPPGLPDPRDDSYVAAMIAAVMPVLEASGGRAFLLFTSHRALREARERLAGQSRWTLLCQGDAPRAELLDRFRRDGSAVLLGTASFWEGVDVRGEALSCVIIDKLPFLSPEDPVLRARLGAVERAGGNPFRDVQLPEAVITLRQGVGRLIRDGTDRGVLVLCDPRLTSRGYGRVFLRSLPEMPATTDIAEVQRFFAAPSRSPD